MAKPGPDWLRKDTGRCRSCGAPIVWWITPNGRRSPHDPDGESHFATCPNAAQHRKPRPAADYGEEPDTKVGKEFVGLLDDAFTRMSLKMLDDTMRVRRARLNEMVRKVEAEARGE